MKVRQDLVLIVMSINTSAPKTLFPWERLLYEEKYGEGAVEHVDKIVTEVSELPDVEAEFGRLDRIFGRDSETNIPHIENVFGHGKLGIAALQKAMKKAVIKTRKQKTPEPKKVEVTKGKEPKPEKEKTESSKPGDPFDK